MSGVATPPWCPRLLAELDAADARARALASTLTPPQLNWKPGPGAWSVGQCLEHLHVANEVYLPPIAAAPSGRPPRVVLDITPGWFGRWFIRRYADPVSDATRARAPGKITPGSHVEPDILDRFLSGNHRVRELVHRAASYDVNRIRFRNPFIPLLRFTVGTGLEVLARHQRRQLLQAERVRASPGFPGREAGPEPPPARP